MEQAINHLKKYTRTYIHIDIHTYIHIYIHTHIHVYVHTKTYIYTNVLVNLLYTSSYL